MSFMHWQEYQSLQKVTEISKGFISYADFGAVEEEILIFLHGIPTWGYLFHEVALGLAPRRVLIPDLMGFGFSSRTDYFDRSISAQTQYILEWMDQLNLQKATFIAHDIGGGVALRLATLYPERVSSLCLFNSVCYDNWPVEVLLQLGHPSVARKMSPGLVKRLMTVALNKALMRKDRKAFTEGLLAPLRTEVGETSLVRNASALNTNLTTEITPLLPTIEVPVKLIWGLRDAFLDVSYARRLLSDIPGAKMAGIKEARHFVMLDKVDECIEALKEHFEVIKAAAPDRPAANEVGTSHSRTVLSLHINETRKWL